MTTRTPTTPKVGDTFECLYMGDHGTTLGTLPVTAVTHVDADRYRLTFDPQRRNGTMVSFTVYARTGRDRNDYCRRKAATAS